MQHFTTTSVEVTGKLLCVHLFLRREFAQYYLQDDTVAAKAFFKKAFKENGRPDKVTIDKSGSNKAALDFFNKDVSKEEEIEIRQIKYLNNIAEQDHRFIKKRTRPMLGFKN